jgi:hypothetical protein
VLTTPIVVKRSLAMPATFAARKRNSSADVVAAAEHGLLERLPGDGLRHARDQPHGIGVDHLLLDLFSASASKA